MWTEGEEEGAKRSLSLPFRHKQLLPNSLIPPLSLSFWSADDVNVP